MKQILFMLFALGLVGSILASAVAQDVAAPASQTAGLNSTEPQDCDSVMSVLLQKKKKHSIGVSVVSRLENPIFRLQRHVYLKS